MDLVGKLILQAVLIAVNAFFASAEIAVISLNANKLKRQAEGGDKKAAQMMKLVEKPEGFLSSIQIGITLAGFLGSAFAADNFADYLTAAIVEGGSAVSPDLINTLSVVVVTLILSFFTLVFGELVPKRVAMQRPDKVARQASAVIYGVSVVMKPVVWLLSVSTNAILRLIRIDPHANENPITEEEIRLMVDIGGEKGGIEPGERELIENVFEFNNRIARDVMTHRTDVEALDEEDTTEEIVKVIEETGLSRLPVYCEDMDNIVGILNAREFLLNERKEDKKPIEELLRPAYFVPETVRADILFKDMQRMKHHIAVVVDEFGGTSGIVTLEDLIEELTGDIYDEFDPSEEPDIRRLKDNLWKVAGGVLLEDLAVALNEELPTDEDFDTLGGLVMSQMNAIPEDGSRPEVDVWGLRIKVLEIADKRVEWALVSKLEEEEAEQD